MKKLLLSLAAVAMAFSASATSVVLFDIDNPGTWETKGTGFETTVTVDGKTFTITTDKGGSTNDLISPVANTNSWRVFKNSNFTISSPDMAMTQVVITYDTYTYQGKGYAFEMALSDGWTGVLDEVTYTLTSAGLNTLTCTPETNQVRIKKVVASDAEGGDPVAPETPVDDTEIYSNTFASDMEGWNQEYISGSMPGTLNVWYINSKQACLCASSYVSDTKTNEAVDCYLTRAFDFSGRTDVALKLEQAYGFYFPTEQGDVCTVNIREEGATDWETLVLTNFPSKGTGNWTGYAENEFDLSEFDGKKVEIGLRYVNDGTFSATWELKNFKLTGTAGVEGVAIDQTDAPAVYYNLQGVRVNNAEKGLFIQVKGNKATKVLVK